MAVRDAVVRGVGIGLLPVFQAYPFTLDGALEEVLPGWGREPVPVHAVYPSSLFLTPKVRAFVDEAVPGFAGIEAPLGRQGRTRSSPRSGGARDRRRSVAS
jgi:DNA-binding transcriptional LysR family regulator